MTYSYGTSYDNGTHVLAPCLQSLCQAIEDSPLYNQLSNLGEEGDLRHQAEGYSSDHNPFVVGPKGSEYPGKGYIRAIDLGGPDALLKKLRAVIWALYAAKDPRVYPFGYSKGCSDNLINCWSPIFRTAVNLGDAGHLHISVTQLDGHNPGPNGWVKALDNRDAWQIDGDEFTMNDADAKQIQAMIDASQVKLLAAINEPWKDGAGQFQDLPTWLRNERDGSLQLQGKAGGGNAK